MASPKEKLGLLQAHLRSANADTERATLEVGRRIRELETTFQALAGSIAATKCTFGDCEQVESLFEGRVREFTLKQEEGAREEAAGRIRMGAELNELERETSAISRISAETRILALNAHIQATSGTSKGGQGFKVVADNVKELAKASQLAAKSIDDKVAAVRKELEHATEALESRQDRLHAIENRQKQLNDQKTKLWQQLLEAQSVLESHSERAAVLVLYVFEAMQLQDVARQKVEHVMEALAELAETADDGASHLDLDHYADGYRMADQRRAHQAVTGEDVGDADEGPAIELF